MAAMTHIGQAFILTALIAAVNADYCPGYTDYRGVWQNGFYCPKYDYTKIYCCAIKSFTIGSTYCCDYDEYQNFGLNETVDEDNYHDNDYEMGEAATTRWPYGRTDDYDNNWVDWNIWNNTAIIDEAVTAVGLGLAAILGIVFGIIALVVIIIVVIVVAVCVCACRSESRRSDTTTLIHHQAMPSSVVAYPPNPVVINNSSTNQLPPPQGVVYQHPAPAYYPTQQPMVSQYTMQTKRV
ncbi:uncharacterized protein [Ptychodera flava]|uniref:uncharacterized protein n=1 Tax=Ptychodera flava TaxID=63121 RepID=UPI00396A150E